MRIAKDKGFSLVELMFVLLIFGLMMLASIPGFGRFLQTWKLHGEIDKMASSMRAARSVAIMKNTDAVFQFNTNQRTYSYYEDLDGNNQRDANEYRSAMHTLPAGIIFQGHTLSGTTITFGPRGNASENGTITMQNGLNRTRQISLFGGTGNIRVDT